VERPCDLAGAGQTYQTHFLHSSPLPIDSIKNAVRPVWAVASMALGRNKRWFATVYSHG
jgi:hypothetical protein